MAIAATGFFDGVHTGHRAVIDQLLKLSAKLGERSMVVTFWPHPRSVLRQDADKLRLLTSLSEKESLIKSLGVDEFVVLPFSRDLSKMTSRDFISLLKTRYGVTHLILGYDHKLGCDGGEVDLMEVCQDVGIEAVKVDEFIDTQCSVSATSIRNLLSEGNVVKASELLGYDYFLNGVVVAGDKIGRTIGFPTANMDLYEPLKLVPSNGVYAVDVLFENVQYKGLCNIGVRPTVSSSKQKRIETHILNFDEEIYGLDLKISFLRKIRDEKQFNSLEELRRQIEIDKSIVSHWN